MMNCPNCFDRTRVTKVRRYDDGVVRYRKCDSCFHTFKTYEINSKLMDNLTKG